MEITSLGSYPHRENKDWCVWFGMTENCFIYVLMDLVNQHRDYWIHTTNDATAIFRFSKPFENLEEAEEKAGVVLYPTDTIPNWVSLNVKKAIQKEADHRKGGELFWGDFGFKEKINEVRQSLGR